MQPGDLFIATNGSGAIGHITYVVEQAKKAGATVAVVTGSPKQTCIFLKRHAKKSLRAFLQ